MENASNKEAEDKLSEGEWYLSQLNHDVDKFRKAQADAATMETEFDRPTKANVMEAVKPFMEKRL